MNCLPFFNTTPRQQWAELNKSKVRTEPGNRAVTRDTMVVHLLVRIVYPEESAFPPLPPAHCLKLSPLPSVNIGNTMTNYYCDKQLYLTAVKFVTDRLWWHTYLSSIYFLLVIVTLSHQHTFETLQNISIWYSVVSLVDRLVAILVGTRSLWPVCVVVMCGSATYCVERLIGWTCLIYDLRSKDVKNMKRYWYAICRI